MAKRITTPKMEKYFIDNALKESIRSMAKKFNVSNIVVKRVFKENNITVPKEVIKKFRTEALTGRTSFTKKQSDFINDNYLEIPIKTIAAILNKSSTGVSKRLKQLGLVIPPELALKRKESGFFVKGQIPVNKGKKQTEFMTAEAIEKTKATRFQKGQIPKNALSDFEEVIRVDKRSSNRQYILIKLPERPKLVYKHIYIWEQYTGKKLEPGFNIVFKDGDTLNILPDNLECISDKELMQRNTYHQYPKEITDLIHIKASITRQINKHKNTQNDRTT
jgi:HNH endonuclease